MRSYSCFRNDVSCVWYGQCDVRQITYGTLSDNTCIAAIADEGGDVDADADEGDDAEPSLLGPEEDAV